LIYLAPRDGEDSAKTNNSLDCLTDANAALEVKGLFGLLPNRTKPPDHPESRSPAGWVDREASDNDRHPGAIEIANTAEADNPQAPVCAQCGNPFEPRKRSGGKPQKFCSTACRQAFHASPNLVLNVGDGPNVGRDVGKDVGKTPNVGTEPSTWQPVLPHYVGPPTPEDDFNWADDPAVVLQTQYGTAIYFNKFDEVVIRQQRFDDEDVFIYIQPTFIREFINRLCAACDITASWGKPGH
jgi:hypothetical protein